MPCEVTGFEEASHGGKDILILCNQLFQHLAGRCMISGLFKSIFIPDLKPLEQNKERFFYI